MGHGQRGSNRLFAAAPPVSSNVEKEAKRFLLDKGTKLQQAAALPARYTDS